MEPVNVNAFHLTGDFAAGVETMFGAVVARSAEGELSPIASGNVYATLGVVVNDVVEQDADGFFADGKPLTAITAGIARVWMLGGVASQTNDFIRACSTVGAGTEKLGICTEETTATTKTLYTLGKIVGPDVGSADYDQVLVSNAASGQKTLTLDATKITALGLSKGDYILIDDDSSAEVKMVDSVSTTEITVKENLTNAYTTAASATVYRLTQAEVQLI